MADGLRADGAGPVEKDKTLVNNDSDLVCDLKTNCENVSQDAKVKMSFYTDRNSVDESVNCALLSVADSKNASDDSSKRVEYAPGQEDDCRKKRCTDRYDSSESSDSGVAVLSCTESSGSDITEPGSPYSPASSGSGLSEERAPAGNPRPRLRPAAVWPWAPPAKRPRTSEPPPGRNAGGRAPTAAKAQPPHRRTAAVADMPSEKNPPESRLRTEGSLPLLPADRKPSDPPQRPNDSEQLKIQQGRITEYFKSQMKPGNGLKRDIAAWIDRAVDGKARNDAADNLEKCISYISRTIAPKMPVERDKLERKPPEPPKAIAAQSVEDARTPPLPALVPPATEKTDLDAFPSPQKPAKERRVNKKPAEKRVRMTEGKKATGAKMRITQVKDGLPPKTNGTVPISFPASTESSDGNGFSTIHHHMREMFMKALTPPNEPAKVEKRDRRPTVVRKKRTPKMNTKSSELANAEPQKVLCTPPQNTPPSVPAVVPHNGLMLAAITIPGQNVSQQQQQQQQHQQQRQNCQKPMVNAANVQTKMDGQFMIMQNINTLVPIPNLMRKMGQTSMQPLNSQNVMQRPTGTLNSMFFNGALLKINTPVPQDLSSLLAKQIIANSNRQGYPVTPKNMATGVPTVVVSKPNFAVNLNRQVFVSSSGFILNPVPNVVTTQTNPSLSHMQQAFGGNVVFTTPMNHNVHITPQMNGSISNLAFQQGTIPVSPIKLADHNRLFLTPVQQQQLVNNLNMNMNNMNVNNNINVNSINVNNNMNINGTMGMNNGMNMNGHLNMASNMSNLNSNLNMGGNPNVNVSTMTEQIVNTTISNTNFTINTSTASMECINTSKIQTFVMNTSMHPMQPPMELIPQTNLVIAQPEIPIPIPPTINYQPAPPICDPVEIISTERPVEKAPSPVSPAFNEISTDSIGADIDLSKIDNLSLDSIVSETKSSSDSVSLDLNITFDTPSIESPVEELSKEIDEDLMVNVNAVDRVVDCQKSPILSQPKTIRFPVKKHHHGEARNRISARSSASEIRICRWSECSQRFDDGADLLEHMQNCHVNSQAGKERYTCLWLGCKVYNRPSCSRCWLEGHVLSHGGSKLFRCIVDGCGRRFNSQLALQRHVNNHFSEQGSSVTPAKKSLDSSGPKLIRRNGKKLRYRRQPWSARMFDFFDAGIMEGLQYRVVQSAAWRRGEAPGSAGGTNLYASERTPHCVTMRATILARRINSETEERECMIRWTPPYVLEDEWIPEKDYSRTKDIPISSLDSAARAELYSGFCSSYRPTTAPPAPATISPSEVTDAQLMKPPNGFCKMLNGIKFDSNHDSHNNNSKTDSLNSTTANNNKECSSIPNGRVSKRSADCGVDDSSGRKATGAAKRKQGRRYIGNPAYRLQSA